MTTHNINRLQYNILVVDDTLANLKILVEILTAYGYKIRPARDGFQALSAAENAPIDLILLDIKMPQMDGYEVCKKLKANPQTCHIPVIFISALNDLLDKVKAFEVGGVDYVTKPFETAEVLARVETHLALHQLQKSWQYKNEELSLANQELANTLYQLKTTQDELIQQEKMAALGKLVAGIAHEINTPLGAITASVSNLEAFWNENLQQLPAFFQGLSAQQQEHFWRLLEIFKQKDNSLSSREKRQIKKSLINQLESYSIDNAAAITNYLMNIGVDDNLESWLPLLKDPDCNYILKIASQIANAQTCTNTIGIASERAAKVVFALKTYSHYDPTGKKVKANIISGIETILTLYHNKLKQGVEVIRNYDQNLPDIECYSDELNQVWTNLIHNAIQAMDNKGTLEIAVAQQDNHIIVQFTDSGCGIPPEIQPRIFEPFFTTKPAGEGSGLGLDIVRKIIDKHHGDIAVKSLQGDTTFTVSLPVTIN
jgi:signal transduction histidine kinase